MIIVMMILLLTTATSDSARVRLPNIMQKASYLHGCHDGIILFITKGKGSKFLLPGADQFIQKMCEKLYNNHSKLKNAVI